MTALPNVIDELLPAEECGRICAVAAEGQRDLQECAVAFADLFPTSSHDSTFFSVVALANAFCAPTLTAEQLRTTNRASLWAFGADLVIDYNATERRQVQDIARRCTDVADGASPVHGDPLTRLLADLRDNLAVAPGFTVLGRIWRDELRRTVNAMAWEWERKAAHATKDASATPTLDEYLDHAHNLAFAFVFASHWAATCRPDATEYVDELRAAAWAVQRVLRLANDLGTYRGGPGDPDALIPGDNPAKVGRRMALLTDHCRELLRPLLARHLPPAVYLDRQLKFNSGFWPVTDHWD